jgi:hypothetical protein
VILEEEFTVKLEAGASPKLSAVAPVKFVPVMTTVFLPMVDPELGAREVMLGTALTYR